MEQKLRRTSVDLTKVAQKVKDEYIHLGLKNILSAGLVLFGKQSDKDKLKALAEANNVDSKPVTKTKKDKK